MSLVELPENNSHPRSDSWVVWRIPPHWAAFALIQLLPTASKLPILLSHAFLLDLIRCGLSPLTMCVVQAGHNLLISPKSAFPRLRIKPFNYITCCSLRLVLSDLLRSGCFFFLKKNKKKNQPSLEKDMTVFLPWFNYFVHWCCLQDYKLIWASTEWANYHVGHTFVDLRISLK